MIAAARLSVCSKYRYCLTRIWDMALPSLPFIMLNPSTADAKVDDPTTRRCIGFARRDGFGGIIVVNLYGLRATDPGELWGCPNPIGPENDHAIARVAIEAHEAKIPIVCAWGTNGAVMDRGAKVIEFMARLDVTGLACLGQTLDGHPRHPLYIAADKPLEPFP